MQAIDIPIGRYMATLLVKVNLIGGLQKQVSGHVSMCVFLGGGGGEGGMNENFVCRLRMMF